MSPSMKTLDSKLRDGVLLHCAFERAGYHRSAFMSQGPIFCESRPPGNTSPNKFSCGLKLLFCTIQPSSNGEKAFH